MWTIIQILTIIVLLLAIIPLGKYTYIQLGRPKLKLGHPKLKFGPPANVRIGRFELSFKNKWERNFVCSVLGVLGIIVIIVSIVAAVDYWGYTSPRIPYTLP